MKKLHQECVRGNSTPIILIDKKEGYYLLREGENGYSYYITDKDENVYEEYYIKDDHFEELMLNLINHKDVEQSKALIRKQETYKKFKKFLNNHGISYTI